MSNPTRAAFPYVYIDRSKPNLEETNVHPGLTKREIFAAMAMQGLMAARVGSLQQVRDEQYAENAVFHADALLAELEKAKS